MQRSRPSLSTTFCVEKNAFSPGETWVKLLHQKTPDNSTKKTPEECISSGVRCPLLLTPSECSRCLVQRSRGTVKAGSEDRSWCGQPKDKKKEGSRSLLVPLIRGSNVPFVT